MLSNNYLNIIIAILILIVIVLLVLHYRKTVLTEKFEIFTPSPSAGPIPTAIQNYLIVNVPLCFALDNEPADITPILQQQNALSSDDMLNILSEIVKIGLQSHAGYFTTSVTSLLENLCSLDVNQDSAMNNFTMPYVKITKSFASMMNKIVNYFSQNAFGEILVKDDDIHQMIKCLRKKYFNLNDPRLNDVNALITDFNTKIDNVSTIFDGTDNLLKFYYGIIALGGFVATNSPNNICDNVDFTLSEYIIDRYKGITNTDQTCLNRSYIPQSTQSPTTPAPTTPHPTTRSATTIANVPFSTVSGDFSLTGMDRGFSYGFAPVGDITLIDSVGPNNFFQPNIRITY